MTIRSYRNFSDCHPLCWKRISHLLLADLQIAAHNFCLHWVVKISHGFIPSFAKNFAAKFVIHCTLHGTFTRCRISRLWGPFKWSMAINCCGGFLIKKKHCSPNGVKVHPDVRPHLLGHCAVQFLASLCFSEVPNNHCIYSVCNEKRPNDTSPNTCANSLLELSFFFSQWVFFFYNSNKHSFVDLLLMILNVASSVHGSSL